MARAREEGGGLFAQRRLRRGGSDRAAGEERQEERSRERKSGSREARPRSARRAAGGAALALAWLACSEPEGAPEAGAGAPPAAAPPPSFAILLADDLGYSDLGVFGHPVILTPSLDRMAAEGQKWTSFYAGAPVCTPSRAALLTGRLAIRSGMDASDRRDRVLLPDSERGLPPQEITLAEYLREAGYATALIGKWHLGSRPPHLPTQNGFHEFFGIPWSHDMERSRGPEGEEIPSVPLLRGEEVIEPAAEVSALTRRFTEEALGFLRRHRGDPFLLVLAWSAPHAPHLPAPEFRGRSRSGAYGDLVEELDWSAGEILDHLRETGLAERTLVVFTSDNGPDPKPPPHGSAGPFQGWKESTFEGGMRVPALFWWPGKIAPGVVSEMGASLDLLPTLLSLAGISPRPDVILDGEDLSPALLGTGPSPRRIMYYYALGHLDAVRWGPFKAHFTTRSGGIAERHRRPLLFNVNHDPGETMDIAILQPDVVRGMRRIRSAHRKTLAPVGGEPAP
jgi:arylsulfatase A-like enzyme